ncbi:hypothetical protein [Streptomyces uncialis]|uniref:hypothetical protein n=1 Tax=Streptomyces uncialis TaxID=1048205 RepID=UPI0033E2837F
MTPDPAARTEQLVRAMARREAAALASSAERLPDLVVRNLDCPCGHVAGDLAEGIDPVRTGRIRELGPHTPRGTADHGLPVLTKLVCERLENRSLLPLAVVLLLRERARPDHAVLPDRFRTRAVALREASTGPSRTPLPAGPKGARALLPLLRRLNDEEAWWPVPSGGRSAESRVRTLPVATYHGATTADAGRAMFLGPHREGPGTGELDEIYLRARRDAVLRAL